MHVFIIFFSLTLRLCLYLKKIQCPLHSTIGMTCVFSLTGYKQLVSRQTHVGLNKDRNTKWKSTIWIFNFYWNWNEKNCRWKPSAHCSYLHPFKSWIQTKITYIASDTKSFRYFLCFLHIVCTYTFRICICNIQHCLFEHKFLRLSMNHRYTRFFLSLILFAFFFLFNMPHSTHSPTYTCECMSFVYHFNYIRPLFEKLKYTNFGNSPNDVCTSQSTCFWMFLAFWNQFGWTYFGRLLLVEHCQTTFYQQNTILLFYSMFLHIEIVSQISSILWCWL